MPSTSVHLPEDLIERLNRAAKRRRVSRNRLIVDACRSAVGDGDAEWPDDFFITDRLPRSGLDLLRSTFAAWSRELSAARKSKKAPPF